MKKEKVNLTVKNNISELKESRTGGQIAVRGFSYQCLYSCYLILSDVNDSFQFEGIEDIDKINVENKDNDVNIQLKYSEHQQDASFLVDVLKNFLEAYLISPSRHFRLVYDFPVANGYMSKLFANNRAGKTRDHWNFVVAKIKEENPAWKWENYDENEFFSRLAFIKVSEKTLVGKIEKLITDRYNITTDNIALYFCALKNLCFEGMKNRSYISKNDVDQCIYNTMNDISKGHQNPAHSWIRKLDYNQQANEEDKSFLEGKKATMSDIVAGLPIRREKLEKEVIDSIDKNRVTVIKSSSGQGKTTLAFQTVFNMKNEYVTYQLLSCKDSENIGDIVDFFKSRVRVGERIIILIDNLDSRYGAWNQLVQLLDNEISCNYKVLVTTREIDWHNYACDVSNIKSINIVQPVLDEEEAEAIYILLNKNGYLHKEIKNWKIAWNKISHEKLLIEYIYLLTHGKMLATRIDEQIKNIGAAAKQFLREICFADICGVPIPVKSFFEKHDRDGSVDVDNMLDSMENEFLVCISNDGKYLEGLHPVRSRHIIDVLHKHRDLDDTAKDVLTLINSKDLSVFFSHIPEFNISKDDFSEAAVEILGDKNDFSTFILAIQGIFSGSVQKYYEHNKVLFDKASECNTLDFVCVDVCPFTQVEGNMHKFNFFEQIGGLLKDNENIICSKEIEKQLTPYVIEKSFIYCFCKRLHDWLTKIEFSKVDDYEHYAEIIEWLYSFCRFFNLANKIDLKQVWIHREEMSLECFSKFMYYVYRGNKDAYMDFVNENLQGILDYLKRKTKSHRLYIDNKNEQIHIEYIIRSKDLQNANQESVDRIEIVCKTLPFFKIYCTDAFKPQLNILKEYPTVDDAHKEMPVENIKIAFHKDLTSLWRKSIMSNYELDTMVEWVEHWLNVRESICLVLEKGIDIICDYLGFKKPNEDVYQFNKFTKEVLGEIKGVKLYPNQERPFKETNDAIRNISDKLNEYVTYYKSFVDCFAKFILHKDDLLFYNLKGMAKSMEVIHSKFSEIAYKYGYKERESGLSTKENSILEDLTVCLAFYYKNNPQIGFTKDVAKLWYENIIQKELDKAQNFLSGLEVYCRLDYPRKTYDDNGLSCYPLIIENVDTLSENGLQNLIPEILNFTITGFDCLFILFLEKKGKVKTNGVKIYKTELIKCVELINEDNIEKINETLHLYPEPITGEVLDCFAETYEVEDNSDIAAFSEHVSVIAEELWICSKSRELLVENADESYLDGILKECEDNVTKEITLLTDMLGKEEFEVLSAIIRAVFNGEKFDNDSYNTLIQNFILRFSEGKK